MINLLIVLYLLLMPAHAGWASYYDKSPTDATLQYRLDAGDIPHDDYDVFIAVADCSRIGEWGAISINDSQLLSYTVFDCAGRDAYDANGELWMNKYGIIVELDYYSTKQYAPCKCGTWVDVYPFMPISAKPKFSRVRLDRDLTALPIPV